MSRIYGDGSNSSIGTQLNDFHFQKKALIESRKDQYFTQLADVTSMPKNMGKKIKRYQYLPLLDDANINDQGLDANGVTAVYKATMILQPPGVTIAANGMNLVYVIGEGANAGAAVTAAQTQANLERAVKEAGYNIVAWNATWADTIDDYQAAGWKVSDDTNNEITGFPYVAPVPTVGNLYGSSKDVGTIAAKLPLLSEQGGRVNRVGFKRKELEGSFEKFGFFDEYTQESLDFDTDADLNMHVNREMVNAAVQISEAALQIDLLNSAGIVRYAGTATSNATIGATSVPVFLDFVKLSIDLDNNRCPKDSELITGTRMVDTKTINAARYMYIGSELITTVKRMKSIDSTSKDGDGFISIEKYAEAGMVARGEIGQVDQFKMIVVPEMLHWAGVGDTANANYYSTNGKFDVFPMLVVGKESFTTIGFQTDGKKVKFNIKHSKPGSNESYGAHDPYGETGFMSIKWYYGFMPLRPERIALIKCAAPYN